MRKETPTMFETIVRIIQTHVEKVNRLGTATVRQHALQ